MNRSRLIRQIQLRTLLLIALGLLLALIVAGYFFEWTWTGFSQKTLFDWLQILVFPAAVAIGTFVLTQTAKRRDDAAEEARKEREETNQEQHAQDAALEAYLEYMSQLLTDRVRPLRRSQPGDNLSVVARAQTLTILGRLNGKRKGSVLRLLYESGLLNKTRPVLRLHGADLSEADLVGINLSGADLTQANLIEADLRLASLSEAKLFAVNLHAANLHGTDLSGADLRSIVIRFNPAKDYMTEAVLITANLSKANLSQAHLSGAYLGGANLHGAELREANLSGANLSGANLSEAKNLTQEQIDQAKGDEKTQLPGGLQKPASWSKSTNEQPNGE